MSVSRSALDSLAARVASAESPPSVEVQRYCTWPDAQRYAGLRLNEYAESARRFVWSELADWYGLSPDHKLVFSGMIARLALELAGDTVTCKRTQQTA